MTPRWFFLLLVLVAVVGASGCASTDDEDISARPWNSPRNWESGMPSGFYEHR